MEAEHSARGRLMAAVGVVFERTLSVVRYPWSGDSATRRRHPGLPELQVT